MHISERFCELVCNKQNRGKRPVFLCFGEENRKTVKMLSADRNNNHLRVNARSSHFVFILAPPLDKSGIDTRAISRGIMALFLYGISFHL